MNRIYLLSKSLWCNRLTACVLAFSLVTALSTVARGQTYMPPPGPPPDARTIAGTRGSGCAEGSETALTALAPYSQIGKTAATRPTFAWYAPDGQSDVEFRLYAYGTNGQLQPQPLYQVMLPNSPGITTLTLPSDQPELSVGQRYYWQVALLCDPAHPSEDLVAGTELEVVAAASNPADLWYDLLRDTVGNNDRILDLLSDLATVETAASVEFSDNAETTSGNQSKNFEVRSEELLQQSRQLRQIVEFEQQ